MSDGYKFQQLKGEILQRSTSSVWDIAKREWRLASVYQVDDPETCLCGHSPINEICVLRNSTNGREAEVGNVCVQKFMGINSQKVFQSLKRVQKDPTKSLSMDVIALFSEQGILQDKDVKFYASIHRKRSISLAQMQWKEDINNRVLQRLVRAELN